MLGVVAVALLGARHVEGDPHEKCPGGSGLTSSWVGLREQPFNRHETCFWQQQGRVEIREERNVERERFILHFDSLLLQSISP